MTTTRRYICVLTAAALAAAATGQQAKTDEPRIYVPYADIAAVVDPAAKAVLMDRAEFAKLLAAAKANAAADSRELGQVATAEYDAVVSGDILAVSGTLTVTSMSDRPVATWPASA